MSRARPSLPRFPFASMICVRHPDGRPIAISVLRGNQILTSSFRPPGGPTPTRGLFLPEKRPARALPAAADRVPRHLRGPASCSHGFHEESDRRRHHPAPGRLARAGRAGQPASGADGVFDPSHLCRDRRGVPLFAVRQPDERPDGERGLSLREMTARRRPAPRAGAFVL